MRDHETRLTELHQRTFNGESPEQAKELLAATVFNLRCNHRLSINAIRGEFHDADRTLLDPEACRAGWKGMVKEMARLRADREQR